MARAHAASGADMVTVAVRPCDLTDKSKDMLDYIDREKILFFRTPPPVTRPTKPFERRASPAK